MKQLWFRAQKKTRRREPLPQGSASAGYEILRLELLEDRTAPSIAGLQPSVVAPIPPVLPIAVVAINTPIHTVDSLRQVHDGATISALRKLLADVQTITPMLVLRAAPAPLDVASLSILFRVGSSGLTPVKGYSDVSGSSGSDAFQPAAQSNPVNLLGKPSGPPGGAAKSDGNGAQPANAPNLPIAAGEAQAMPQARATGTREVALPRTDAVPTPAHAGRRPCRSEDHVTLP